MKKTGYIKLNRQLFEHLLWTEKRVFSKLEAWIDLIQTARYASTGTKREIIDKKIITWERGQLVASIRFLKERWNWKSNGKVENFLTFLVSEKMITIDNTQGINIITLINYDKYNTGDGEDETETEAMETLPVPVENLHPLQEYIKLSFPAISRLKSQLTRIECEKLVNEFSKELINEVLIDMENYKPLIKKYKSVNLTLRSWIKLREERKSNHGNTKRAKGDVTEQDLKNTLRNLYE